MSIIFSEFQVYFCALILTPQLYIDSLFLNTVVIFLNIWRVV